MFNIYNYILAGGYGLFVLLDVLVPARRFPSSRWWKLRGVASAALYIALASYSPYLWMDWLNNFTLIDSTALPLILAVPAAALLAGSVRAYREAFVLDLDAPDGEDDALAA